MKCDNNIMHLMGKVNRMMLCCGMNLLREEKIHPGQVPLLVELAKGEGLTQKELADRLEVKPSSLNVMVNRLLKNDLITKTQDKDDQRRSQISLTKLGEKKIQLVYRSHKIMEEKIFDCFSQKEEDEMIRLLTKLHQRLEEELTDCTLEGKDGCHA